MRRSLTVACLFALAVVVSSASYARQLSGLELASFPGREVLVVRTGGKVAAPSTFSRDSGAGTLSFTLAGVGADGLAVPAGLSLIRRVGLADSGSGLKLTLTLDPPALASQEHFRISQPSEHLILIEVFPGGSDKQSAERLTDPDAQLNLDPPPAAAVQPPAQPAAPQPALQIASRDSMVASALGVPTVDLSRADPQRVLGLAAKTGLLKLGGNSHVATESLGEVSVKPAGMSVASWSTETPPGELYLSGTREQVAEFLRLAEPRVVDSHPTVQQVWETTRPKNAVSPAVSPSGGRGAAAPGGARLNQYRPDPYARLGTTNRLPGGGQLSDVLVTLPATGGMNLYDVLTYLSVVSGISIIIDPYAFDDPMGNRPWREPLIPELPEGEDGAPGFRPGSIFSPGIGSSGGTVRGNFDNMPFDQALSIILQTHGLEFVVYGGEGSVGVNRAPRSVNLDNFVKPIILVTNRERVEQELGGTNSVSFGQIHYGDPVQISEALGSLHMLSTTGSGWYVYQGGGDGAGGGSNGGGAFGGGRGGTGGGGGGVGGGGGLNKATLKTANSGLLVYRGSHREPILGRVRELVDAGKPVVRVLLPQESGGYTVTGLALP